MAFSWLEDDLSEDLFRDAPTKSAPEKNAALVVLTPNTPALNAATAKAAFEAQKKQALEAYLAQLKKLQARAVRPSPSDTVYYKHAVSTATPKSAHGGGVHKRILAKLRGNSLSGKARPNPKGTLAALTRKVLEDVDPKN